MQIHRVSDDDTAIHKESNHINTGERSRLQNLAGSMGRSMVSHLKDDARDVIDGTIQNVEGGEEVKESTGLVETILSPAKQAAEHIISTANKAADKSNLVKKADKPVKIAQKVAKKTAKATVKETAKESTKTTVKETVKISVQTASSTASSAGGPYGTLIGMAAGEAIDKIDVDMQRRRRTAKYAAQNFKQEENKDSLSKTVKDLIVINLKHQAGKVLRFFLMIGCTIVLIIIITAGLLYLIFGELYYMADQITAPVADSILEPARDLCENFMDEINNIAETHEGCDSGRIIYTGYAEDEEPVLNYYELVSLYRVYSDDIYFNCADTAANIDCLKTIFNDMCSYQTKIVTEEYENTDGEIVSETVLIVDVTIHDVMELAEKYQFTEIQMEGLEFLLSLLPADQK